MQVLTVSALFFLQAEDGIRDYKVTGVQTCALPILGATMALTVAPVSGVKDTVWGNRRVRTRTVTFDSSYATGGEPLKPSDFNLKQIDEVIVTGPARKNDGSNAAIASYDQPNQTLMAYWPAAPGA